MQPLLDVDVDVVALSLGLFLLSVAKLRSFQVFILLSRHLRGELPLAVKNAAVVGDLILDNVALPRS